MSGQQGRTSFRDPQVAGDQVVGYLVTAKIIEEGGYETRGLFREVGFFSTEAQDIVIDTVHRLAERAGRKLPQ